MAIHVTSEIGQLKRVLLKRPGRELEHLSPETMEQLLFDDIPYLHRAQAEHDRFAELLRESGAEVSYLDSLIAEVLEKEPALRELFVSDVIEKAGGSARGYREALTEYLLSMQDARTLVRKTMAGVTCVAREMPLALKALSAALPKTVPSDTPSVSSSPHWFRKYTPV